MFFLIKLLDTTIPILYDLTILLFTLDYTSFFSNPIALYTRRSTYVLTKQNAVLYYLLISINISSFYYAFWFLNYCFLSFNIFNNISI